MLEQLPAAGLEGIVLQASGQPSELVVVVLQAYELVGAALGVFIAYLAYQGYRRNNSRPMLFVSLGFALALGLPLVFTLVYFALPISGGQAIVQAITQTVEILGLLCIIHGLRL